MKQFDEAIKFAVDAHSGMQRRRRKARSDREKLQSYTDLTVGDLVVHEIHGIGRFAVKNFPQKIEHALEDQRVAVPVERKRPVLYAHIQPDMGLAAFDQPVVGFVFFIQRRKRHGQLDQIGILLKAVAQLLKLPDEPGLFFVDRIHFPMPGSAAIRSMAAISASISSLVL